MKQAVFVAIVLLAGCLGAPADDPPPQSAQEGEAAARPVQRLQACDELDFYRPVAYSTAGLGPFRPVAADPSGQTMNLLYTVMRCASANGTIGDAKDVVAMFTILVVQPLAGYEIEGSAGYQLVRALTTDNADLIADWSERGVASAKANVSLSFGGQAGMPKSTAELAVNSDQHSVSGSSSMTSQLGSGPAGVLGLYTLNDTSPMLHKVEFSTYQYYPRGVAMLRPGPMGAPVNTVQAYHNVGFSVVFQLDEKT